MLYKAKFSGKEIAKHVIVISIDALSESEWFLLKEMPQFSDLINTGVYSKELMSVFPTHTYTVHTTMVTGVYPDKHGIVNNHPLQPFVPEDKQKWYWYQKNIKVPTVYDLTKMHGLTSAGLLWPVSGKSSITWHFPEIIALEGENQVLKIFRSASFFYLLGLEMRYRKKRISTSQPEFDDFVTLCACDTIKRKKSNLTLVHLCDLDNTKHTNRVESPEVKKSLKRLDNRLGLILQSIKDAQIEKDTIIIVLGDHGQFSVDKNVHINNILRDCNLIFEENGKMTWRAYLQTTGGNAGLYVKSGDREAEHIAIEALTAAMGSEQFGIQKIHNRDDLDRYHADLNISYSVEAKPGYHFDESLSEQTVEDYVEKGIRYATHGYAPDQPGYQCLFFAKGPGILKNSNIGPINMVDIAPTLAELLGLEFYPCDGTSLVNLFTENKYSD